MDITTTMAYKGMMLSGIPNIPRLANASWTLKRPTWCSESSVACWNYMDDNGLTPWSSMTGPWQMSKSGPSWSPPQVTALAGRAGLHTAPESELPTCHRLIRRARSTTRAGSPVPAPVGLGLSDGLAPV